MTRIDGARIDWTARVVRVTGVGTPRVLSPTGAITERDPYDQARADAEARLARALGGVPIDRTRRARALTALTPARRAAARAYTSEQALHFSDGTVHLPAAASFGWIAEKWPAEEAAPASTRPHAQPEVAPEAAPEAAPAVSPEVTPGASAAAEGQGEGSAAPASPVGARAPTAEAPIADDPRRAATPPTGIIIQASTPIEPAVRLTLLGPEGQVLPAGVSGDRVGPQGALWIRRADDPRALTWAGAQPLRLVGERPSNPRPGAIRLGDDAAPLFDGGVNVEAIVVILPPEEE